MLMNTKSLTLAFLAATTFGSLAQAQSSTRHFGTVVQSGSGYTLAEFHDPSLLLETSLNLDIYLDEVVDLTGHLHSAANGSGQGFEVDTIALADRAFSSDHVGVLGAPARLRIDAVGVANYFVHVSLGYGYNPLVAYGPSVEGVLWLDPNIILSVAGGSLLDRWRGDVYVPNDPYLLGLTLYFQASVHEAGQPLLFLNSNEMTFSSI